MLNIQFMQADNPAHPEIKTLLLNRGSSSLKFAVFSQQAKRLAYGQLTGMGQAHGQGKPIALSLHAIGTEQQMQSVEMQNVFENSAEDGADNAASAAQQAIRILLAMLGQKGLLENVGAIVHRLVHGGPQYWQTQFIDHAMLQALRQISPFDPEHMPQALELIGLMQQQFPELPQIACFDTAFHHQMPQQAQILPLPYRYFQQGVRRYGFHGLSCAYLMRALAQLDAQQAQGRVVIAHLGSGASITAVLHGQSMDSSMSFTPTSGIPMSCRAGDLDPSLAHYFASTEQMSTAQFQQMVNTESGLLGVSGISGDMQKLLAVQESAPQARLAVAMFCYHIRKSIAAMAASLQGLDCLIFSAGIGQAAPVVRQMICAGLNWMGIELDAKQNAANAAIISSQHSRVMVRVIATDEEDEMRQQASKLYVTKGEGV